MSWKSEVGRRKIEYSDFFHAINTTALNVKIVVASRIKFPSLEGIGVGF
ncbi:MAG: hypothetical protein ACJA2S_005787 [Cyclobacteriaceae bacterium]|jgi:hypothetical protein